MERFLEHHRKYKEKIKQYFVERGIMMEAVKDYTVRIDSKKRITLRGARYQYYNVKWRCIGGS